jgi:spore coat protein CotF
MPTMMSTLSEATGMKPDDRVIGLGALSAAKMKAMMYTQATLETATPEVRHIFTNHLQAALAAHERATKLAIQKGWYKAQEGAEALLKQAVADAAPVLQ